MKTRTRRLSIIMVICLMISSMSIYVEGFFRSSTETIRFAYDDFSDYSHNQFLKLTGRKDNGKSAEVIRSVLRLTPKGGSPVAGAAYYKDQIALGADRSFSTFFTFKVTPGSMAADGFTFSMNTAVNELNDDHGTMGMPHTKGFSLEFDTYNNGANNSYNDQSNNHIALDINGIPADTPANHVLELGDEIILASGDLKYTWIDYDGENKVFTVTISSTNDKASGKTLRMEDVDLTSVLDSSNVYAGFTAEHYGSGEQHDIYSWYFDNKYNPLNTAEKSYISGAAKMTVNALIQETGKASVEIATMNADGSAAPNTKVELSASKGDLDRTSVTTDSQGKAFVTLTGDDLIGTNITAVTDTGLTARTMVEASGESKVINLAYSDFADEVMNKGLKITGLSDSVPNPYGNWPIRPQVTNGVIRLTPYKWNPAIGAVYSNSKIALDENKSFSTFFTFDILNGAEEGLVFSLNCSTNMASSMAEEIMSRRETNVAIEFDTRNNGSAQGDTDDNHLGYSYRVNNPNNTGTSYYPNKQKLNNIRLADGQKKYAWIDYDGASDTLSVSVSNTMNRGEGETMRVENAGLKDVLPGNEVYAGINALTRIGDTESRQQVENNIYNWFFAPQYDPIDRLSYNYMGAPDKISLTAYAIRDKEQTADVVVDIVNRDGSVGANLDVTLKAERGQFENGSNVISLTTDQYGRASAALSGSDIISAKVTAQVFGGAAASTYVQVIDDPFLTTVAYPNFNTMATNNLLNFTGANERAYASGGRLVLTNSDTSESGGVFVDNKILLNADRSFSTFFTFRISETSSKPGDGMAFVMASNVKSNGGIGASGYDGIGNSIGIEFDTYQNDKVDADGNHMAYNTNGNPDSKAAMCLDRDPSRGDFVAVNLADGKLKYAWIDYDGSSDNGTLTMSISDTPVRGEGRTEVVRGADIGSNFTTDDVYIGFTASNGNFYSKHEVYSWYFDNQFNPIDNQKLNDYQSNAAVVTLDADQLSGIVGGTQVYVTLKTPAGAPIAHRNVQLTTTRGYLENTVLATDENGVAQTTFYDIGVSKGAATFRASTDGGWTGKLSVECEPPAMDGQISYAFNGFSDEKLNEYLKLSGVSNRPSKISGGILRLTPDNGSGETCGAAYTQNQIMLPEDRSFKTFFSFRITPGSQAADGFCFIMNGSANELGDHNTMGMPTNSDSFAVEFDTYDNGDTGGNNYNDNSDNHIALDIAGLPRNTTDAEKLELKGTDIRLSDGGLKYAWIEYNGETGEFTISISNNTTREAGKTLVIPNVDLKKVFPSGAVYVGFAGGHYGSNQQHDIYSWCFNNSGKEMNVNNTIFTTAPTSVEARVTPVSADTAEVILHVKNYDGTPAAGAKVALQSDNAQLTFEPATAVADENGRAVIQVKGQNLNGSKLLAVLEGGAFQELTIPRVGILLKGEEEIIASYGEPFVDPGATAYDFVDGDLTDRIQSDAAAVVDTSVVGVYTVTYKVTNSAGQEAAATRTVRVIDTTIPVLTLKGAAQMTTEGGFPYVEPGVEAMDAYDGDLSDQVIAYGNVDIRKKGIYLINYEVTDSSGNRAEPVSRSVTVIDTTAPVITLNGNAEMKVEQYAGFEDPGAYATDNVDVKYYLTQKIVKTGDVNTDVLGQYALTYNVTDESGNAAEPVSRIVKVVEEGSLDDGGGNKKTGDDFASGSPVQQMALKVFIFSAAALILLKEKDVLKERGDSDVM